MSLYEKACAAIAEYNMLKAGDRVITGVSGGADSVALLHFLVSIRRELDVEITAAHLNHGLRGDESTRDESFVKKLCADLGVECVSEKADVYKISKDFGMSLEEAGRKARYDFFNQAAKRKNAKIATAHSLNDSVETVLLNLARGTDLRGLCGIPAVSGNVIRPLISCGRDEIEAYCKENGLDYVTDSSNASDDFSRNRIRHHVLPVLTSINSRLYKTAALNMAARAADADFLDGLADKTLASITLENGRFSRDEYLSCHQAIRFRMLLSVLSQDGASVDARRLSRLDGLVNAGSGAEQLSDKLYFKADSRSFYCFSPAVCEDISESFCINLSVPKSPYSAIIDVFPDKKLELINTDYEYYEKNIKYAPIPLKNCVDCGRIVGNLILRGRLPSDKIKLVNRGCTKSLKKLFSEAKIPIPEREKIFVLADDGGVVWVEGFGAAARASPASNTKDCLIFNIRKGT